MTPGTRPFAHLPERFTAALLLPALVVGLIYGGWLWEWDQVLYDGYLRYATRAEPANDIVIVAIDERSMRELGHWPWPRRYHAELVDRLTAAGARGVALDVIFAEPDPNDPDGDAALARAVGANGRVVLPVANAAERLGGQLFELFPLPALAGSAAGFGHVDLPLDADGIARSAFLRAGLGDPRWPSLGLALLEITGEGVGQLPGLRSPREVRPSPLIWARDHQVWIPFAGPPGHYRSVSFVDVMRGEVPADLLEDRYVLVGATAIGLGDVLPTPVSGQANPMPGVEIVANILDTVRSGNAITPLGFLWHALLSVGLVLVPALLYPYVAPRWSVSIAVVSLGAVLASGLVLLHQLHLWFPPTAALLGVVLGYVSWSWRRLVETVRYLNQELLRLDAQPSGVPAVTGLTLAEAMEFIRHVLPVDGGIVWDPGVGVREAWGRSPGAPPEAPPAKHGWIERGKRLWTAVPMGEGTGCFGVSWTAAEPPGAGQRGLLEGIAASFSRPKNTTPWGPVEVIEERIRQVAEATERLQAMRQFIGSSLAQMADGVLVTDLVGRVLLANERAAELLVRDAAADLRGRGAESLFQHVDFAGDDAWRHGLAGALLRSETSHLEARTGGGVDLLVQVAPLAEKRGRVNGVILNMVDISQLRASERRRAELLGFLSHDLRSPLVSLLGITQMARLDPAGGGDTRTYERIEMHARRTLELADTFLEMARAETIDGIDMVELDLVDVARRAAAQVQPQAEAKRSRLQHSVPHPVCLLQGDEQLLERAIVNLLTNAVKYSPEGSLISLAVYRQGESACCCVKDDGPGIAQADIPTLFARFRRLRQSGGRREHGVGLGLAFVKAVVDRHHGVVEVSSQPGEGTEFCLKLPVIQPGTGETG